MAHCLVHQQLCVVNPPRADFDRWPRKDISSKSLVSSNAGNCCQGWTAEGKRARKAHSSQHALAAWTCQRKELGRRGEEDMFFQECTPLFDIHGCLESPLAETHRLVSVVTGPSMMGWPTSRDRLLSAGLSLKSLVWVGPQDPQEIQAEFEKTFEKRCMLSGSVFFRADEDEVARWCQETLRRKKHFGPMPTGYKLWRKLFTPGQLQRMEQYRALQSEQAGIDGTFICDLDHWPNSPGPQPGPFFPTLLRHGTIVDMNAEKIAMSSDRFLALGFHIGPVSSKFQWPLAEYVLSLPDRALKSFSGNCQSLPAILAWQLYVFCNTVKRDTPQIEVNIFNLSNGAESETEEAEQG